MPCQLCQFPVQSPCRVACSDSVRGRPVPDDGCLGAKMARVTGSHPVLESEQPVVISGEDDKHCMFGGYCTEMSYLRFQVVSSSRPSRPSFLLDIYVYLSSLLDQALYLSDELKLVAEVVQR